MEMTGNTILITGGSSGIGMALAERFLKLGNEVIVCGRREDALKTLASRLPGLHYLVADTGSPSDREKLAGEVTQKFPRLNVVINNAGIQRRTPLTRPEPWADIASEIDINFAGPVHMASLMIPHLVKQPRAHLMNVSSGLAFVPLARMAVYCATKAAVHSFTMSLREQLRGTSVTVTEIIPPAVKTNLGGSHDFGVELNDYADSVIAQLREGRTETTFESSARSAQMSRAEQDELFAKMNR